VQGAHLPTHSPTPAPTAAPPAFCAQRATRRRDSMCCAGQMAYGAGSEFDGEMCDCRPGFKNVNGKCIPIEQPKRKVHPAPSHIAPPQPCVRPWGTPVGYASCLAAAAEGGLSGAVQARAPTKHRSYDEAAVYSGARGQEAMNAAWRKQATKAVQDDSVNYNRLCQQEFGIGAEYDGARPLANPKAAAKIEGLA
jgi:hypothetical protein